MKTGLNRFDRLAPIYDFLAGVVFGKAIRKAQEIHLSMVVSNDNVLVLGGGSGKWMKELLQRNPHCKVDFIEASAKMLDIARRNNSGYLDRIKFIHGTERDISAIKYDVVITHFFLDMYSDQELIQLVRRLKSHIATNGIWLVADFVNERMWHRMLLRLMYLFFGFLEAIDVKTLPSWQSVLQNNGIVAHTEARFFGQFISCKVYKVSS